MPAVPSCVCEVDGFLADLDTDDFVDDDDDSDTDDLPSYLEETGYIVIDICNTGTNPFFPEKFEWRFALISVLPEHSGNLLAYGGITFVPIIKTLNDVAKVTIKEDGANVVLLVYLEKDTENNPHVMVYLTDIAVV